MTVLRGNLPSDGFTIIPNAWIRDGRMSAKAKGLLCYIASHAAGYSLTIRQMLTEMGDGEAAVRSGLAELEQLGYLQRNRLREDDGRMGGYEWSLGEVPAQSQNGFSSLENSSVDNHVTKKTTPKKTNPSSSKRGTRLPDGWMPSDDMKAWCERTLPEELYAVIGMHLLKFRNYWTSKSGRDATKLSWDKTFQNWMISEAERFGRKPTSGAPAKSFTEQAADFKQQQADRKQARALRVDELLEQHPGMSVYDAISQAEAEIEAHLAQSGLASSSSGAYIEGVILDEDQKEVTGS